MKVVRDSRGHARDLLIVGIEVRVPEHGYLAALVGRPLADVSPDIAGELLRRIDVVAVLDAQTNESLAARVHG